MKFKHLVILLFALIPAFFIMGCGNNSNIHKGKVEVIFELEGGEYGNSTYPVHHFYSFKEGTENLIQDISAYEGHKTFMRVGYDFQGWYRVKNVEGDKVTYEGKWDFATDKVTSEGVTLYAYWTPTLHHIFNVCYKDEGGNKVILGSYDNQGGKKFKDILDYKDGRKGYTAVGFLNEDGTPWDNDFVHPGGEQDLSIDVYVDYIKGDFKLVSTAKELARYSGNYNIYLLNDIDLGGDTFAMKEYKALTDSEENSSKDEIKNKDKYQHIFKGNGHIISNFKIKYNPTKTGLMKDFDDPTKLSLGISLFGITKDAIVEDVKFNDVTIEVKTTFSLTSKIYVAPLAISSINTTFKNVEFNGKLSVAKLPNGFDQINNLIIVTDKPCYKNDDGSKFENININLEVIEGEQK